MKKNHLTIGCRARILTLKEKPKQTGPGFFSNEGSWRSDYGDREVLLTERSSGTGNFAVMLLGKGVKELKKRDPRTVGNRMAWIDEEDMVLIDKNFDTNLDFIDWYQTHEDEFCPDCGAWFPDNGRGDACCPNKKCPGN